MDVAELKRVEEKQKCDDAKIEEIRYRNGISFFLSNNLSI